MGSDSLVPLRPFSFDLSTQIDVLEKNKCLTLVNVGNVTAKSFVISQLLDSTDFSNVLWASTDEKFDHIGSAAELFFPGKLHLVKKDMSLGDFYEIRDLMAREEKYLFLFEDLESLMSQSFPTEDDIVSAKISLKKGQKLRIFELFEKLEALGYMTAEENILKRGEFVRRGDTLFLFPENALMCFRIELFGDQIEGIYEFDQISDEGAARSSLEHECKVMEIFPVRFSEERKGTFFDMIDGCKKSLFISDDLDQALHPRGDFSTILFTTFPDNNELFFHLNFFSVLPFYTIPDFVVDIKERLRREFDIVIMTKKFDEVTRIFRDNEVMFTEKLGDKTPSTVKIIRSGRESFLPHSFQNNDQKLFFLTDREIFKFARSSRQKKTITNVNLDLMTSLKPGNLVVHSDHGLAKFDGIVRRDLGDAFGGIREYLKLCYAGTDKLFVPVESAEKITKFIGDTEPKLTKLGSSEWTQSQRKLKAEAEKIAKELLALYAKRSLSKGKKFASDDEMLKDFCDGFPYELTPGQAQTWSDVKQDLENPRPMDRLVCGDVGFGKTEIAMRSAFKCFRSGMQAVILAPITILAEQHYQNFMKRIVGKNYGVRVALLSRFQTAKDQKQILSDIEHGLVDIVIGTHRVLSDDIKFQKLGLIVIDEEQRFGVKQKEKLKKLRASVDILTMTATPIPRTLNMGLNKLKDISTITTPPPGRLPVVTEVRKYNLNLIRDRILLELKRGGQVYFLHNRVETIEAQAAQLRALIPEAKFLVAHGQLAPLELEKRIRAFKEAEYDVLVASTIIENGIDLPNANTLLVNFAEKFGLSQLYQLRGRVGRRRLQAYAYFLYHGQKLELEAKKRLRAIVEASELGSGFQIAMRDLEIRGAGDILGVGQSGTLKSVGVSHFMRMLQKTIEEMKSGEVSMDIEEEKAITVEIPLSAYIPARFIPQTQEKIQVYKELASVQSKEQLDDLRKDLREDYGALPVEVENLCKVIALKLLLREVNIEGVRINRSSHRSMEIVLRMGEKFTPDQIFGLVQHSKNKWVITANALKLAVPKLPVNWYDDLVSDVKLLRIKKKSSKRGDGRKIKNVKD